MTSTAPKQNKHQNKRHYIKLKRFCTAKETVKKMIRQPTEWEKVFVNQVLDEVFISKFIKNSYNSISKKQTI